MTPSLSELNLGATLPAVLLSVGTIFLLMVDIFLPKERRHLTAWLALAGLAVSFILTLANFNTQGLALVGMFIADPFTSFMSMIVLITAALTVLIGIDYMKRTGIARGEFWSLLLLSTAGVMFMASANDLIVVFIALELLSIPLYVMAAFRSNNAKSEEAGMKYFILGAFASAFFVYGSALVYGATGTTNLTEIVGAVAGITASGGASLGYLLVGAGLIIVALGFKVAVVPFHMWTPDVYEGAPTPVTAYMSVGAKIGGFAALLRVLVTALPELTAGASPDPVWQNTVMIIAALTMIVGNFVAMSQTNLKRMFAYSSIAHAGYILMAIAAAANPDYADAAAKAALIYLLSYAFTNLGAFGVILAIEKNDGTGTELSNLVGFARSKPIMAAMMTVFMFSLTGIPLTAGFTGKWFVFQSAIGAGLFPLTIIGVLTSVVSAYYYVRVIVNMYLVDGEGDAAEGATPYVSWAIYASFAGVVVLGLFPILAANLTEAVTLVAAR